MTINDKKQKTNLKKQIKYKFENSKYPPVQPL